MKASEFIAMLDAATPEELREIAARLIGSLLDADLVDVSLVNHLIDVHDRLD
jgi:hypothetical protein